VFSAIGLAAALGVFCFARQMGLATSASRNNVCGIVVIITVTLAVTVCLSWHLVPAEELPLIPPDELASKE
jgi:hypothetical protein